MQIAVLFDGGFFLKRHRAVYPKTHRNDPENVASDIVRLAKRHVKYENGSLYRIFYYDCWPFEKKCITR